MLYQGSPCAGYGKDKRGQTSRTKTGHGRRQRWKRGPGTDGRLGEGGRESGSHLGDLERSRDLSLHLGWETKTERSSASPVCVLGQITSSLRASESSSVKWDQ